MKMHFRKTAALILAACLSMAAFSGCAVNVNPADSENPAMVVCGEKINLDEVKLYIYMSQYDLEKTYHDLLIASYKTMKAFWVDNGSWSSVQYQGPGRLFQTKLLLKYAEQNGISLTAEEKAAAEEARQKFLADGQKVLEYAGKPSDALVIRYFEENALANKAYQTIVKDIDTTFDEEAMLRKTFEGIYVVAATKKTTSDDTKESASASESESAAEGETKNEEPAEYTEEEQTKAREAALNIAYDMLKAGNTLDEIKEKFTDDPTVTVNAIENRSISKTQMESSTTTYPYYQIAWELKTGEYSKDIIETSSGTKVGYALHMLNDDDDDARAAAKESELATRRGDKFKEVYAGLLERYKEMHVYEDKTFAVDFQGDAYIVESEPAASESESETSK